MSKQRSRQKISQSEQSIAFANIAVATFTRIFDAQQLSLRLSRPNMFWKATDVLFLVSNKISFEF